MSVMQHNNTQHINTQQNEAWNSDTQNNGTHLEETKCYAGFKQHNMTAN
jgi:hypothetical protein